MYWEYGNSNRDYGNCYGSDNNSDANLMTINIKLMFLVTWVLYLGRTLETKLRVGGDRVVQEGDRA